MVKLKRLYYDGPRERWPIGWATLDNRFSIEEKQAGTDACWWLLKDSKTNLTVHRKEHDSLKDARECIEVILAEEKGEET